MCQYAYYDNDKELYCKINKKRCLYSKYCVKQNRYIHKDGAEDCYMALEEKRKTIPTDAYYVRFVRKGFVYVDINGKVVKVKDTIGNVDNYVYAIEKNGEYLISLTPFTTIEEDKPKKRQYNRKKK